MKCSTIKPSNGMSASIPNHKRRTVYRRDYYCCAICDDNRHLQVHHVVPRCQGGTNHMMNLITLCHRCHALVHGTNLFDGEVCTPAEMAQSIVEYMADYYAPIWNPWAKSVHDRNGGNEE